MYKAVIFSIGETELYNSNPKNALRLLKSAQKITDNHSPAILGRDSLNEDLYVLEPYCGVDDQYINDRMETVCRKCDYVLGR